MKKFLVMLLVFLLAACHAMAEDALFVQGGSGAQLDGEYYMRIDEGETDALVRIGADGTPSIALRGDEIGDMAEADSTLYFLLRTGDTWSLMSIAGGRMRTVYTFDAGVTVSDIGVRDGLVFLLLDGRLHILYTEHSMCLQLSGVPMDEFVIHDDYAYYISSDDRLEYEMTDGKGNVASAEKGALCRVNMSTGRYETLLEDGADSLRYSGGRLYFHYFGERYLTGAGESMTICGRLCSYDAATGELEVLTGMYDWEFYTGENCVYVLRSGTIVKLDGSDKETILCAVPPVVEIADTGDALAVFDPGSMTFGIIAK